MNIVFIGSSSFGEKSLHLLNNMIDCKVTGVVTNSKEFSISYSTEKVINVLHADIPSFCENNKINYVIIKKKMFDQSLYEKIESWKPEAFIVVGWYHMIPKKWRELAPAYGMHASLLPEYSGGAPLVWAIINNEKSTGITLFQMDNGIDTGPILGQVKEKILANDTIDTLYRRIEKLGLNLLKKYVPKIRNNTIKLKIQDESKRTTFPQRSPKDGEINWAWDINKIKNFIRAQTKPYPGAFTVINNKKVIIWDADIIKETIVDD